MKNKIIKVYSELFKREFTYIVDDTIEPSPTTGDGLVARKLREANDHLSKIKNLDEILKRHANDFSPE
ncbi:hypothetical protein A4H97_25685 [Niastella yeongjuensis]|uniref:Uncharacterized protein n=1 Tax=Niastella yeongjuensis TaxID=354355 RepID=A0A1V9F0Y6_9BACT|nr:hypothetical protein [Niastella yeongjuensis]OQP52010.1 hypothetical protein A4H97_25685 [Niastella yeongjuensis]SEP36452.1 hypothetical protein SAMN05660816_05480 [Niastella yeongjuensis]